MLTPCPNCERLRWELDEALRRLEEQRGLMAKDEMMRYHHIRFTIQKIAEVHRLRDQLSLMFQSIGEFPKKEGP